MEHIIYEGNTLLEYYFELGLKYGREISALHNSAEYTKSESRILNRVEEMHPDQYPTFKRGIMEARRLYDIDTALKDLEKWVRPEARMHHHARLTVGLTKLSVQTNFFDWQRRVKDALSAVGVKILSVHHDHRLRRSAVGSKFNAHEFVAERLLAPYADARTTWLVNTERDAENALSELACLEEELALRQRGEGAAKQEIPDSIDEICAPQDTLETVAQNCTSHCALSARGKIEVSDDAESCGNKGAPTNKFEPTIGDENSSRSRRKRVNYAELAGVQKQKRRKTADTLDKKRQSVRRRASSKAYRQISPEAFEEEDRECAAEEINLLESGFPTFEAADTGKEDEEEQPPLMAARVYARSLDLIPTPLDKSDAWMRRMVKLRMSDIDSSMEPNVLEDDYVTDFAEESYYDLPAPSTVCAKAVLSSKLADPKLETPTIGRISRPEDVIDDFKAQTERSISSALTEPEIDLHGVLKTQKSKKMAQRIQEFCTQIKASVSHLPMTPDFLNLDELAPELASESASKLRARLRSAMASIHRSRVSESQALQWHERIVETMKRGMEADAHRLADMRSRCGKLAALAQLDSQAWARIGTCADIIRTKMPNENATHILPFEIL